MTENLSMESTHYYFFQKYNYVLDNYICVLRVNSLNSAAFDHYKQELNNVCLVGTTCTTL